MPAVNNLRPMTWPRLPRPLRRLFMAEREGGIDAHGTAGGEVTGQQSRRAQRQRHGGEGHCVRRGDFEQQALQHARESHRREHTGRRANGLDLFRSQRNGVMSRISAADPG